MRDWDWLRPHTLNLYQYVGNDPINKWDPTGFTPAERARKAFVDETGNTLYLNAAGEGLSGLVEAVVEDSPMSMQAWKDSAQAGLNRAIGPIGDLFSAATNVEANGQAVLNGIETVGDSVSHLMNFYGGGNLGSNIGSMMDNLSSREMGRFSWVLAKLSYAVLSFGAKAPRSSEQGGLNLFKWGDNTSTKPAGWKNGDRMLHLSDRGSPKLNWQQNAGRLRAEMSKGKPIYDSYRGSATGQQIPTKGFLNAERKLLESKGWAYNSKTGAYHPPGN